ncbi:MAG: tryptophan halogenase family protein [Asticcacaulis sp.]
MEKLIQSIVIVGGGSAGWITAGTIAAKLKTDGAKGVSVTLVESPNIPIIGVGEGTWPTMRKTLKRMGIRETDFIRNSHVSFKQGARFNGWATGKSDDGYYHPLILPQGYFDINLAPHWLEDGAGLAFASAVCPQADLCDRGLAPKLITTPEYAGIANYAYHLDAGAFAGFLRDHCISQLGVRHVLDDVTGVNAHEDGDIASVATKTSGDIAGDLFIDCSGFKSLLLGQHFGVPFRSCKDVLFIDTALAAHAPYESDDSPILSHTLSTAQTSGWIWDVALPSRRGTGHVYSSAHISDTKAEAQFRDYLRPTVKNVDALEFRKISINAGRRETFWERNCVGVGLASGFLEPLESSALLLIEIAAGHIANQMPATRSTMDIVAKRYNRTFLYHWERIVDFLKLHYVLSERTDSDFWIDNRHPASVPESLQELLELWKYHQPWHDDFERAIEVFPAASYQYVLYGMGFKPQASHLGISESSRREARDLFRFNADETRQMVTKLPTNRELIDKIHQYGLQRV